MKASSYNIFVHYVPDNVYIGYNCVSGGMYVFNDKHFDLVNQILRYPEKTNGNGTNAIKDKLEKGRFLVGDDLDELKMLKLRHNMAKYNPNGLGLVVTPTLRCNFNCPYCYVDRDKIAMSEQKKKAIKNFFNKKIEKCEKTTVCWTGGEPLLALDIVEDMQLYFCGKCREKSVALSSIMVTNGYSLTPKVVERLKRCGINDLQITLDGYKEYHDKLRFTEAGGKTYERIVKNVVKASQSGLKIILRSNIEKNNYEGIYKLIDDLAERGLNKENVIFAPCMVMDVKTSKGHYKGHCYSKNEFSLLEPGIILYSLEKGFKINKGILSTNRTFCGANTLSLYVIDSYANILKCWCNLGRSEKNKVGYIKDNGEPCITGYENLCKWMSWDPFEIKECINCKILPICMGGCMYYNVMEETDTIDIGCSLRRYNIEEILKIYYISASKKEHRPKDINTSNNNQIVE